MSADLNQQLYQASYQALTEHGVSEALADVVSRVVACDEPGLPNLGRNDIDVEICREVAIQINLNSQQQVS